VPFLQFEFKQHEHEQQQQLYRLPDIIAHNFQSIFPYHSHKAALCIRLDTEIRRNTKICVPNN